MRFTMTKVVLILGVVLSLACLVISSRIRVDFVVGGASAEKEGDATAQAIADSVKPEILEKLGISHELKEFVVEKYTEQLVAGSNYSLKIRISPGNYIHAHVFEPLPYTKEKNQLHGVEKDKKLADKIG